MLVAAALFAFFRFAPLGKAIRACADNYTGALVVGLDVKRLYALTFGLGAACVGAAGAMLVLIVDVTPPLGPAYTLLAFVIVITGGLGSMPGALLGGVLIGLTEAMAGLLFTPSAKSMFAFAILVLVLLFRPQGILGKRAGMIARLLDGVPRRALLLLRVLLLAVLVAAPLFANDYLLTVLILILYFAYTGQAWNIMMGFAGQLSLGHALYVGLGAYTTAALYVHFGIGPWLGLLVAIPVAVACGAVIGFLAFRFGVAGVYFAILTIAFAEFARIGFDHFGWVGGSSRPVPAGRAIHPQRSLEPARPAGDVLLRDPGADRAGLRAVPRAAAKPRRLLLAGDPRGRGGGALARHRHVPLQDDRGGDLGRHDVARRRVLCVLLQQPVSRAGVPHLALDRDDPRADHRRHRHAVRPDDRRVPAHRAVARRCRSCWHALGIDMPGAKQVFYGVCLLLVVMVLPRRHLAVARAPARPRRSS